MKFHATNVIRIAWIWFQTEAEEKKNGQKSAKIKSIRLDVAVQRIEVKHSCHAESMELPLKSANDFEEFKNKETKTNVNWHITSAHCVWRQTEIES